MAAALAVVNGVVLLTDGCRQGEFTCVKMQLFKPNLRRRGGNEGRGRSIWLLGCLSVVGRGWDSQARLKMSQSQSHDAEEDARSCCRDSLHGAWHPPLFLFSYLSHRGVGTNTTNLGSRKMVRSPARDPKGAYPQEKVSFASNY